MKIVVLAGGLSPERNVSRSTGAKVCSALRERGHQAALVDLFFGLEDYDGSLESCFEAPISEDWKAVDKKAPDLAEVKASRKWKSDSAFGKGVLELCGMADIVFLALHGQCGEDGRVQATFDLLGIPYTGAGYLSTAIAMDKDMTKRMVAHRVLTPEWKTVEYTAEDIEGLVAEASLPVVVKPVANGSSIGVSIAFTEEELRSALEAGLETGGPTVLEQYVKGREFSVGILHDQVLPPIEIIPKSDFYNYENKYQPGATIEVCPADITPEQGKIMQKAAMEVFRILGLSVYSRADFILTEDNKAYFLEINTLPGMTPTSLLPQEAAAAGIDYSTLCEKVLELSLEARKQGM
jgi:D-alanine-D-alanine ligase